MPKSNTLKPGTSSLTELKNSTKVILPSLVTHSGNKFDSGSESAASRDTKPRTPETEADFTKAATSTALRRPYLRSVSCTEVRNNEKPGQSTPAPRLRQAAKLSRQAKRLNWRSTEKVMRVILRNG